MTKCVMSVVLITSKAWSCAVYYKSSSNLFMIKCRAFEVLYI